MMRVARFPVLVLAPVLVLVLVPVPGHAADRTQVYSIQGADCASCAEAIKGELKKIPGVRKVEFDKHAVEITVKMDDRVADGAILAGVARAREGLTAVVGPGKDAYLAAEPFPAGADFRVLTSDGSAVGPLPKLAVAGKYTVFDVYADWCGPCRVVDERLRTIVAARSDVAVRKLNVVDFDRPLARELGAGFDTLPFLVVITPAGRKVEIAGGDEDELDRALRSP
jgi:copper chaperone CopZ/thiol-disulfide isomerase/thioredoxin